MDRSGESVLKSQMVRAPSLPMASLRPENGSPLAARDGIGKHAHERALRPVHMERVGVNGGAVGIDDALLVIVVRERLRGREKRGADPRALRARPQCGGKAFAVRNPARRDHRHVDAGDNLRQQLGEFDAAAHMAARFHPLRDDDLRARRLRRFGFFRVAHLASHQNTFVAQAFDDIRRQITEQRHRRHLCRDAGGEFGLQQFRLGRGGDKVHAEIAVRALAHPGDFRCDQFRAFAHHAQKAETARIGDRRHEFRTRRSAHACQQDGIATAQKIANGCVEDGLHRTNAFLLSRIALLAADRT
jgi:hypothetical protein